MLASALPVPELLPSVHVRFNEYLAFDLNWSAIHAALYILYYFVLEPTAAVRTCLLSLSLSLPPTARHPSSAPLTRAHDITVPVRPAAHALAAHRHGLRRHP